MAGNFNYDTYVVSDATATFNNKGLDGQNFSAELMHETSLASLNEEFATIVTTNDLKQSMLLRQNKKTPAVARLRRVIKNLKDNFTRHALFCKLSRKIKDMNYTWVAVIVVYIVLTHLIAKYIGEKRKIGYGKSVFWSVLLSPIIGLMITGMSKPIDEQ